MTPDEIRTAYAEKRRFMWGVLAAVLYNGFSLFQREFIALHPKLVTPIFVLSIVILIYNLVTTWRLFRAMKFGVAASVVALLLVPLFLVLIAIAVIFIFSKRTGIPLGETLPE